MMPALLTPAAWAEHPGVLAALWAGRGHAYAVYGDGETVAVALETNAYPALSPRHPAAAWFERLARDLEGAVAIGAVDTAPAIAQPRDAEGSETWADDPFAKLPPVAGQHQAAWGPVHGLIAPPLRQRVLLGGGTVRAMTSRLGYGHRGLTALMRGKSPRLAARFAARLAGGAAVAHGIAFARAAEDGLGVAVPPRAVALRAAIAGLERIQSHLVCLATMAEAAGTERLAVRLHRHRAALATACETAFGHRLMMDVVIPGGVAGDIATGGGQAILAALEGLEAALSGLRRGFGGGLLHGRLAGLGPVPPALAAAFAQPEAGGDAAARAARRLRELAAAPSAIRQTLATLPEGTIATAPPAGTGHGIAQAAAPDGTAWCALQIENGLIAHAFLADPATRLLPLLHRAAIGTALADLPLLQASFNVSVAGLDL